MPEHDISKHTKAIYETIKQPGKNWKHKFVDILIEIFIIVFAITLSLLLERWREDSHDKNIEKKFLLGLQTDLKNDITQLKSDSISYHTFYFGWNYLRTAGINKIPLNKDSLKIYGNTLINTTDFIPNNSRFEALKSSGQFNVLENDSLQNIILDLYQNKIVLLKSSTAYISGFKTQQLFPFLSKNIRYNKDGSNNLQQLVELPEMQNYLLLGVSGIEAMNRYHDVINQSEKIIAMIDQQYNG